MSLLPWYYFLKEDEQVLLESYTKKWTVDGPGSVFVPPFVTGIVRKGHSLSPTEYSRVKNLLTGSVEVKKGPTFFFIGPYEEVIEINDIMVLQHNQYAKLIDKTSGKIRVLKGPCNVVPEANETILVNPTEGVNIDEHTSVMVRNTSDGSLRLVTDKQVFFPDAKEQIERIDRRILLESHESVIIKDKNGKYKVINGCDVDESFFLQPYEQLLCLKWSSGIEKNARELAITHIDRRPKFMWYEFSVRTKDNVELILAVTFFWQICDVEKMIKTTDDAPGDVCSHARSMIIQSISKATLDEFLDKFNLIVKDATSLPEDNFYDDRGVAIHSVEVRSISCKEKSIQNVLQEIIRETTDRLNRLQKQQSENEVRLNEVKGKIEIENQKGALIEVQRINLLKESEMSGEAEARKIACFFKNLDSKLNNSEKISIFNTLKKLDYIDKLSESNANMFFTPNDVDLRIETAAPKNTKS